MSNDCRPLACNAQPKTWHILLTPDGTYFERLWHGDSWGSMTVEAFNGVGIKYICPYFDMDCFSISQVLQINGYVSHLHEANNREVEAHRETKAQLRQLQAVLNKLIGLRGSDAPKLCQCN